MMSLIPIMLMGHLLAGLVTAGDASDVTHHTYMQLRLRMPCRQ